MTTRDLDKLIEKLAYSVPAFATAVDVSRSKVYEEIRDGNLIPSYVNSKPLITKEEGLRWLSALPTEKPGAAA